MSGVKVIIEDTKKKLGKHDLFYGFSALLGLCVGFIFSGTETGFKFVTLYLLTVIGLFTMKIAKALED